MLKTLMGDYPVTEQFKKHTHRFAFTDLKGAGPASLFKRVVRDLEFDVSEMAIMTHLIAKAHGKPYRMLPFVVMARLQHPFLVFNAERTPSLKPEDLHGKRVGVRSYSVTTGAWIRGILSDDYGIDISKILPLGFATDQTYQSVLSGESQLGETSTTDGTLESQGLVVLEDDKGVQPVYEPAPIIREAVLQANPQIEELLKPVFEKLDLATLQELNGRIQVGGEAAKDVAVDWLTTNGFLK